MDYDTDIFLARQSAQEILLVQIWTAMLSLVPDGKTMATVLREQTLTSLGNSLELRNGADAERVQRVRDHTINHIEEFWDKVDILINNKTV